MATKALEAQEAARKPSGPRTSYAEMSRKPKCKGMVNGENHCHKTHKVVEDEDNRAPSIDREVVSGSGEELQATLEKIVSQLGMISETLHVLEQRVSMNEDSTTQVLSYFEDARKRKSEQSKQVVYYDPAAIGRSMREERMRHLQ